MKYEGLGLTDDMLVHLLLSKLEGYPRVVVDALPRAVREAGFAALIAALVEKFSENDSASQMKAYMALKTLSKRSDVSSYCVELEKLTQRAYPSASEADLSCTRAGELVAQLADWPEYLQLYTTMEVAPRECAYEWVKNLALRCERSRELARTAKATTEVLKSHTTPHGYDGLTTTRETQLNTNRGRTARLKQSKDATDTGQRLPRCYNCNEYGHFSRDCKKQRKADDKAVPASSRRNPEGPRVLTASWGRRIGDAGEILSPNYDLVGERTVRNVHLLGLTRKALLDTGSQISILPRQVIRAAELAGLDTDVETVPITGEHAVYDASGHRMKFGGAVRLAIQIEDGPKHRIPLFIMDGDDEMIVLGTNALKTLGFCLTKSDSNHESFLDLRKAENGAEGSSPATKCQNVTRSAASTRVVASERVYIRPGEQKVVTIKGPHRLGSGILWSECDLIPDMVCNGLGKTVQVTVTNGGSEAKIVRGGQTMGRFEPTAVAELEPVSCNHMLERTAAQVTDREQKLSLLGIDHPLHLRHQCGCGLFNQMAHVALPSLSHPMARAKKVNDMFQLANVASIAEQSCWGDERKEEELRKKNSSYITPYGLALAVDAHRRRCDVYAEAVDKARGVQLEHSAVFPTPLNYDLGDRLVTAIAMLDHTRLPGTIHRDQDVFLALPPPFARLNAEVDYPSHVVPFVYPDWSALAQKMIAMPITTSVIIVWPESTPESRQMRQVLIALERHLQC
ncbi:unnamed protein product, partial [Nippostrongylus brasiliensis]|uniref:CCHC-type domain-containing protein n=1 Tax=Nippostrongylus brasiliensis TaxID=27835 RepID=A0A0N4YYM6_NIPBR